MRKLNILYGLLLAILLASCAGSREFNKLLKSNDQEQKFVSAKEYFANGKFSRSLALLESVTPYFRGTRYAHEVMFLTAKSHAGLKDNLTAAHFFESYHRLFPRNEFAEESKFMEGYSYYLESPDPRLDQQMTHKGIAVFNSFIELYPESARMAEAAKLLDELNDKLAQKELLNTRLYFNMGIFLGNNYRAAAITAENAIKDFPASRHREEFAILILRSRFREAEVSVQARKAERYQDALLAFQNYIADFPEGRHVREAQRIHAEILKNIQ